MAKITIDIPDDIILDLFKQAQKKEEVKEQPKWWVESVSDAGKKKGDKETDQIITGFKQKVRGEKSPYTEWTVTYKMANDNSGTEYEYDIPKGHTSIIEEAIEKGILVEGALVWITTRYVGIGKRRAWVKIESDKPF